MLRKITWLLIVIATPVYAQIGGQSVYQFLNLVQSPRQAAMGGKTVTIPVLFKNGCTSNII